MDERIREILNGSAIDLRGKGLECREDLFRDPLGNTDESLLFHIIHLFKTYILPLGKVDKRNTFRQQGQKQRKKKC